MADRPLTQTETVVLAGIRSLRSLCAYPTSPERSRLLRLEDELRRALAGTPLDLDERRARLRPVLEWLEFPSSASESRLAVTLDCAPPDPIEFLRAIPELRGRWIHPNLAPEQGHMFAFLSYAVRMGLRPISLAAAQPLTPQERRRYAGGPPFGEFEPVAAVVELEMPHECFREFFHALRGSVAQLAVGWRS